MNINNPYQLIVCFEEINWLFDNYVIPLLSETQRLNELLTSSTTKSVNFIPLFLYPLLPYLATMPELIAFPIWRYGPGIIDEIKDITESFDGSFGQEFRPNNKNKYNENQNYLNHNPVVANCDSWKHAK